MNIPFVPKVFAQEVVPAANYNSEMHANLSDDQQEIYDQLLYNISFSLEGEKYFVIGDEDPRSLTMRSHSDMGELTVNMFSYGMACPVVTTTNLCENDLNLRLNPYEQAHNFLISLLGNKA